MRYQLQQVPREINTGPRLVPDHAYLRLKRRPEGNFSKYVKLVDLFSGVGSLTLGVWEAARRLGIGIRPVAVDINRYALAVYARNFPSSDVLAQDVASLIDGELSKPPTKNEKRFVKYLGRITMLLSGSPCQGFCPLNNYTRGRDERNWLYLRATRLVELARPAHVLLENVPDVVNGEVDVVGRTIEAFTNWGYYVDAGAFDLAQIGLPQHRKRHVVVASLRRKVSIDAMVEKYRVERPRNVRWSIAGLEDEYPFDLLTTPSKQIQENKTRIRYMFRNGTYNLPNWMRPRCHKHGNHSYKSMYGRLKYDLPAQTITGGFQSPGQGRFVHPSRERTLTPHEAGRLQFFPDFFDFSPAPTRTMLSEMIGNAAPMKLSLMFTLETLGTEVRSKDGSTQAIT